MIGEWRTFTYIETCTSEILFNEYLKIKIRIGVDNVLLFYSFDSDIFCSIDLLFLWQRWWT